MSGRVLNSIAGNSKMAQLDLVQILEAGENECVGFKSFGVSHNE